MRRLLAPLLVAVALTASAARAGEAQTAPAIPADVYAPLVMEEGTWDADVTFHESEKPSGRATGVQVNTLLANGHWMVNPFTITAHGKLPAHEGHGV